MINTSTASKPIEPIGVPTSISYVGSSISPYDSSSSSYYTNEVFFGYDGFSLYYRSITPSENLIIKQFKMSSQYDITTLNLSSPTSSGQWSTTTGNVSDYFMNFSGTNAIARDYTFIRRDGS